MKAKTLIMHTYLDFTSYLISFNLVHIETLLAITYFLNIVRYVVVLGSRHRFAELNQNV